MSGTYYRRSAAVMGTIVTIQTAGQAPDPETIERAFGWFHRIEECCTRFDPGSELMRLTAQAGAAVPVSAILFEAVRFAVAVAEESAGAFDPAVGHAMERRGFNREHRSGSAVRTVLEHSEPVSYRDIRLDAERSTITLLRPMVLDLGAVAKGLAIDMAARELQPLGNFGIDAGGDLYLGGCGPEGLPWSVGIRHPRRDNELIHSIRVSDRAVCTSGDYERRDHILDPRTGDPARRAASVTVVASSAMLADALATAAFVLGPAEGIEMLNRHAVEGLIFSAALDRYATPGMCA